MKRKNLFLLGLALVILLPSLWLLVFPDGFPPRQTEAVRQIVILYTNDDHGWIEPSAQAGGAPGLAAAWKQEGVNLGQPGNKGPFLILSGGDLWTGPAVSAVTHGEAMVDVMNTLGYSAAAIGNHDFDYGVENLKLRASQANFPLLSANLLDGKTGETPGFAHAFTILDVNGVKVGVIGLTTLETPIDTRPGNVAAFDFIPYEQALEEVVPQVKAQGAELLVVAGHICNNEARALAPTAARLGIAVIGAGHCHEELNETVDGVRLVQAGYFWTEYARLELYFDRASGKVIWSKGSLVKNQPGRTDAALGAQVESWREKAAAAYPGLWEPIGYTETGIDRNSPEMERLLTRAWLAADPQAQVAIASPRYVQQSIPPGKITPASLIGVLCTENNLLEVGLSGAQLQEIERSNRPISGSLRSDGLSGLPEKEIYRTLIPENLYQGGNYYNVKKYDSNPVETGIDWRQAVISYVETLGSNETRPLEAILGE